MNLLEELTHRLLKDKSDDFSKWVIVFPNKRAGLFFKKMISQQIDQPIWSPTILSISDVFEQLSPYQIADKISLVFKLYRILEKHYSKKESFEQFFYWGEALLADFEEIDKYLINPRHIFKDLRDVKELESNLPFLDEHQKKWILQFWESFKDVLSKDQQETLGIWRVLLKVYSEFTHELISENQVYQGLAYRWVGEQLEHGIDIPYQKIIFAGFNALSTAEEKLITWCRQHKDCEVYWDADDYYLNDKYQEAGDFLREYQSKGGALASTFKNEYKSSSFIDKNIKVIECSTDTGQAQEVGKIIEELSKEGIVPEKTGIILPNEKLLLPLLDAIPQSIDALNITMGYPLQNSLTFSFLVAILELQSEHKSRANSFYYKSVIKLLYHPFIFSQEKNTAKNIIDKINQENMHYPDQFLFNENELLAIIFRKIDGSNELIEYLQECLQLVNQEDNDDFEIEFSFHFYRLLNNLKDVCNTYQLDLNHASIIRLLNHAIYRERLPFEGEPLEGLQIMGFMETRNLHFDHVILLSAEEGTLPPAKQDVSFIPFALRKAYGLPTVDHSDAIFSYLFYRLIHNCNALTILYNSNSEKGNTGEISRFVKQLEIESPINIKYQTQNLFISPSQNHSITIEKSEEILNRLKRYTLREDGQHKRFSPSALNTFLECSLRFYFRYVLDLFEDDEIDESIKERELGLLFHHAIELTYQSFDIDEKRKVTASDIDLLIKNIDEPIRKAFAEYYYLENADKLKLSGQSELVYEVIKELLLQVLKIDKKYAPFEIMGVESDHESGYLLDVPIEVDQQKYTVGIKGVIDRIDKKEGIIRIIDYKTGRDTREFTDIPSLFDASNKSRNKAVFQTYLYALFYLNANPESSEVIQTGLFNLKDMYRNDFEILIQQKVQKAKSEVKDIRPFLDEYKSELTNLLQKIFNSNIGFVQTEDDRKCKFCPYNQICNRESA